ncbi:MAG: helix-turn-helix domain-containing protein [Planctomycetes bacterium]|nr:helix-turn-helix domain-containing protein [Planctomycetota bacterium]
MGGMENRAEIVRDLLMEKKVVSLQRIAEHLKISERTAQRHLKVLQALSSFSHKRQFVTLPDIPQFDEHGVWFYRNVGFSRFGNSLEAVVALVEQSKEGFSREELEAILKIGIAQQIQTLIQRDRLHRVKLGNRYLYLPEAVQKNKRKRLELIGDRQTEEYFEKDVPKTDLVALLKAVLVEKKVGVDIETIKRIAKKYSLRLSLQKIQRLLVKYDLPVKKRP